MNFRNNQILKKIRNVIYEQQRKSLFDSNVSLREKCGLHTPIFLRFARQSLTHLHAFFDGVHTSMLALLRHPKWTFFSVQISFCLGFLVATA